MAREAFGEQPRHRADIAIGQARNRDEVQDRLIVGKNVVPRSGQTASASGGRRRPAPARRTCFRGPARNHGRAGNAGRRRRRAEDAHRRGRHRLAGGEAVGRLLRQEAEALADGAAGQRRNQIVDELAVRFRCKSSCAHLQREGHHEIERCLFTDQLGLMLMHGLARRNVIGPHVDPQQALDARLVAQRCIT